MGASVPFPSGKIPRAVVFGCSGTALRDAEREFFREADPLGFILFRRNVSTPDRLVRLVDALRGAVSRPDAPVLIDQEGGRVQRLGPPRWTSRPAMRRFGERMMRSPEDALACARLNAGLVAADLRALGITVNCAPVLDLPLGHDVIGDRAFSEDPEAAASLGRSVCEGFASAGVVPVIKHLPGHGRAEVDSHFALPRVDASRELLAATDFVPFAALRDAPAGMTAHVVYSALDDSRPASASATVIAGTIRGDIGFDGLLFSDDVCMKALSGAPAERIAAVLEAGCDVALHCNGSLSEMREVSEACPPMTSEAVRRLERAVRACVPAEGGFDPAAAAQRVDAFLASKT